MVLRMKNVNILGVHWKIQLYEGEGSRKTNTEGGECQTAGAGLGLFADLRAAWQERERGVLMRRGGWDPNEHYGKATL